MPLASGFSVFDFGLIAPAATGITSSGIFVLGASGAPGASIFDNAGLAVSIALAVGMALQCLARHLQLPALLLLLAAGVLLGPDGLGVVRPGSLGTALQSLVGFAVGVILFEGGLNLNIKRLRRESTTIQWLITVGALVTAGGAAVAARLFMGWDWPVSILFGTLVIVTGPTVIGPLLRRVRVQRSVSTVLEAEGVLIDAVGAITAAVALEVVLSAEETWFGGVINMGGRLGFGVGLGLVGGFGIGQLLKRRKLIPEGFENALVLSLCLVLFQVANAIMHESGIAAVTVAGLVVGNMGVHARRELVEFKEQLTVLFIGMLFVLLAADVRLSSVMGLGWGALGTVAALVLVVRPLNVIASTWRSDLGARQKLFLAWIAPRGIVAAAVASLFAQDLPDPTGTELRALVFLVIAITVLLAGVTGAPVASWLGLRRPTQNGWVILGANELARQLARILRNGGQEVVLLDSNADSTKAAEKDQLRVIFGNGLEERTLQRAEIDTRAGAIGLSPNDELNVLFLQAAKREGKVHRLLAGQLEDAQKKLLEEIGAEVLFGRMHDVALWCVRLRRKTADLEQWEYRPSMAPSDGGEIETPTEGEPAETESAEKATPENSSSADPFGVRRGAQLALAVEREGKRFPVADRTKLEEGDRLFMLVYREKREEVEQTFIEHGWRRMEQVAEKPLESL